jgi:hypothetical protein
MEARQEFDILYEITRIMGDIFCYEEGIRGHSIARLAVEGGFAQSMIGLSIIYSAEIGRIGAPILSRAQ